MLKPVPVIYISLEDTCLLSQTYVKPKLKTSLKFPGRHQEHLKYIHIFLLWQWMCLSCFVNGLWTLWYWFFSFMIYYVQSLGHTTLRQYLFYCMHWGTRLYKYDAASIFCPSTARWQTWFFCDRRKLNALSCSKGLSQYCFRNQHY